MEREGGSPAACSGTACSTSGIPPLWETGRRTSRSRGEVLDLATGLIVHSRYVERARARARLRAGRSGSSRIPAWPAPPRAARAASRATAHRRLRQPQRVEARAAAARGVRALPRGRHPGARLLLVGATSPGFDLDRRIAAPGSTRTRLVREDYVDEERLWALMAGVDVARQPPLADDGRDSGTRDPRALARQAARRQRRRLVLGASGRRRAEGPVGRARDARRSPPRSSCSPIRPCASVDGRGRARSRRDASTRSTASPSSTWRRSRRRPAAPRSPSAVLRDVARGRRGGRDRARLGRGAALARALAEVELGRRRAGALARSPCAPCRLGLARRRSSPSRRSSAALLARRMLAPWIMVDELIYSELAKSFAASGHFLVRDVADGRLRVRLPGPDQPRVRALRVAPDAYAAAKTINALLMSLAAVPAYLLARRRRCRQRLALARGAARRRGAVAGLHGDADDRERLLPDLPARGARARARRSSGRRRGGSSSLLALLALAYLTRAQALAFLPALLTAPLLLALFAAPAARPAARSASLYGVVVGGAVLVRRCRSPRAASRRSALLGAYAVVGDEQLRLGGKCCRLLVYHVAELDLYLGVVPVRGARAPRVVAPRCRAACRRSSPRRRPLLAWLALEVAAFASRPSPTGSRSGTLFYVAPLFLIALLVWVERGAPRPRLAAARAAALAARCSPLRSRSSGFIGVAGRRPTRCAAPDGGRSSSTGTVALHQARLTSFSARSLSRRCLPARAAAVRARAAARRARLLARRLAPIWYGPIRTAVKQAVAGALFQGIRGVQRDWIDERRAARRTTSRCCGRATADRFTVNQNEFFNRSVGPVYYTGGPTPGGARARRRSRVDRAPAPARRPTARPSGPRTCSPTAPSSSDGDAVARDRARDDAAGASRRRCVTTTRGRGLYPNDTWSGAERDVLARALRRRARSLVTLSERRALFPDGRTS